ncbi:Maf family protein [Desulfonauticus submarinus]
MKRGPFRNKKDIVLASKSPRRQELLSLLGICFYVHPSKFKEPKPFNISPSDYALLLAKKKAEEVAHTFPQAAVLGADTIVVIGDKILGKPKNQSQALEYLTLLRGKIHTVITAVALIEKNTVHTFFVQSKVKIANFSSSVLKNYIATQEPLDKAGAYAVQGIGGFLVEEIQGSYTNVIGLPLTETTKLLIEKQIIVLNQ